MAQASKSEARPSVSLPSEGNLRGLDEGNTATLLCNFDRVAWILVGYLSSRQANSLRSLHRN